MDTISAVKNRILQLCGERNISCLLYTSLQQPSGGTAGQALHTGGQPRVNAGVPVFTCLLYTSRVLHRRARLP